MTKLVYRGYEVAANDNVKAGAERKADLVYRGAKNDNVKIARSLVNAVKSRLVYRGSAA